MAQAGNVANANHKGIEMLIQNDCLLALQNIADKSVDLVLCDPPYGTTYATWDTPLNWTRMWQELLRVGKPTTAYLFFSQQPFSAKLLLTQPDLFKYEIIWQKEKGVNFITASKRIMKAHENILVFYDKQCTYNPQMVDGEPYVRTQGKCTAGETHSYIPNPTNKVSNGKRYPLSVQKFSRDMHRDKANHHPTAKPVGLLEWLIKTYTNEGDLVLDPTAGSGSTGVAAENTGRKFICIEQDEKYFQMMHRRLRNREQITC